jgi:hypothetical protein
MNDQQLKKGLRQLVDQGWFVAKITDEFVESLLGRESDQPFEELKEHFLSRLRARIKDAPAQSRSNSGPLAMKHDNPFGSKRSKGQGDKKGEI